MRHITCHCTRPSGCTFVKLQRIRIALLPKPCTLLSWQSAGGGTAQRLAQVLRQHDAGVGAPWRPAAGGAPAQLIVRLAVDRQLEALCHRADREPRTCSKPTRQYQVSVHAAASG